MPGLQPTHASDPERYQLIDIRPTLERYSGMGFVAGSLSLPRSNELQADAEAIERIAGAKLPVLLCLTGHRAHGLALALAQCVEIPLSYVEGGLFAWNAEALPLAGLRLTEQLQSPLSPSDFDATVRAQLDALLIDSPIDACETVELVLQRCLMGMGRRMECCTPRQLRTLMDLLAVVLLDLGVPRWEVSDLLDGLLVRLPSVWHDDAVVR